MRKLLHRLARDKRGAAIVEMAFIAPIVGGMAAVSFGIWDAASRQQDMNAALEVAAEYYMNGGTNDGAAEAAARSAWRNKPADGEVSTTRICRCGTVVVVCDSLCTGNTPPSVYVQLTANASDGEAMFGQHQSSERVVRVR